MFSINPARQARHHIKEIRDDFDLNSRHGPSRHVQALERALTLLSDQLYQKPTHFLLELIQNADDNEYEAPEPSLTFTYENKKLRVDCNEKGFSKNNVEAICRIGQSTKAGQDGATRYVGEKGIGFKSVFKIADKVWISSNHYAFKFDKSQPLGMIAPIWEEFPQPTIANTTSMLLELTPSYDENELIQELQKLDPRMLIFLRRLREIKVRMRKHGRNEWETVLKREDGLVRGELAVALKQNSNTFRYIRSQHQVSLMPQDPNRPGLRRSEILLAFPIPENKAEPPPSQKVYAFLPIRDYGFKFLLQADFLLSASREDILTGSQWNVALRAAFVDAFVAAAERSHNGFLQYLWPRFLPSEPLATNFFEPARKSIINTLKARRVLKNWYGQVYRPTELMHVPEEFRTVSKTPVLLLGASGKSYLSDEYDKACTEPLEKIGLRKMTLKDFVQILKDLLVKEKGIFRAQPNEWHADFSSCLLSALWRFDEDQAQWNIVRGLEIVPLEDGSWVAPSEADVFLPPDTERDFELGELKVRLVRKQAAQDRKRAALFKHLGIGTVNQLEMCNYIASTHEKNKSPWSSLTVEQLVSQTMFFFNAGWRNTRGKDLWFANRDGGIVRGSTLYIPSTAKYAASHYFPSEGRRFLHDSYLAKAQTLRDGDRFFKQWLEDCAQLSELPRLINPNSANKKITICRDFLEIAENGTEPMWPYILRDNYRKYPIFELDLLLSNPIYFNMFGERNAALEKSHEDFIKSVGRLRVRCIDGSTASLNETYLPLPSLKEDAAGFISFLDVTEPENISWKSLKQFGLGTDPNLAFYLYCLEKLSPVHNKLPAQNIEKQVSTCLDQIQARYAEDVELVKKSFSEKCLIRVKPISQAGGYRWVNSPLCLWDGASCFRRLPALKAQYPGNRTLFQQVLGIKDAQFTDLLTEADRIVEGDDLDHIKELFAEIEKRLDENQANDHGVLRRLVTRRIFPIRGTNQPAFDVLGYECLRKVSSNHDWFMADRQNLLESFRNRIPLLAFGVERINRLELTAEKFKLDDRKLSRRAVSTAETNGSSTLNWKLTNDFRERIHNILRLIHTTVPMKTKRRIAKQLRTLRIFYARTLIQRWSVQLANGLKVDGIPMKSNVVFSTEDDGSLHIFFSEKYMARSICKTDVVQHFADFCEVRDRLHLLNMALWENPKEVEAIFRNYGVPPLDPEIEAEVPEQEDDDVEMPNDSNNLNRETEDSDDKTLNGEGDYIERLVKGGNGVRPPNVQHEDRPRLVCAHCAAGQGDFGAVGIRTLFGNAVPKPASNGFAAFSTNQTLSGDHRDVNGFPNAIRILGFSSWQAGLPGDLGHDSGAGSDVDSDLQLKGEKFISTTLSNFLGARYSANNHWTSNLRARAGFSPFTGSAETHATFTVPDDSGVLLRAMLQGHAQLAQHWAATPPTWHFEVKTTKGDLHTPFYMTNEQVQRARSFTTANCDPTTHPPTDIVVLVRIYNADRADDPDVTFYRDPWGMFLNGDVLMKADTKFKCGIKVEAYDPPPVGRNDGTPARPPPPYADPNVSSATGRQSWVPPRLPTPRTSVAPAGQHPPAYWYDDDDDDDDMIPQCL